MRNPYFLRILPMLAAVVTALALSACGNDDDDDTAAPDDDDTIVVNDDDTGNDDDIVPPPTCPLHYHYEDAVCIADPAPPALGRWHTRDGAIWDPLGREVILHGINISNDVKDPPHESWATGPDYALLRSWGFNFIRLLTGWAAIMPEEGVIDEEYLARYDQRVDWAEQNGLMVMIDMHQDLFGEGFSGGGNGAPRWACDEALYAAYLPQTPWYRNYASPQVQECYDRFWTSEELQNDYIDAWATIAARYADREHVIAYDLMNEPYFGTIDHGEFHRDYLQGLYEKVIVRLEEVAPGRLYFVEPATTSQLSIEPEFEPFDSDAVVYAPHYYHRGVHDYHRYDGNPEPIRAIFDLYQRTAERLGVPWLLGEHGGYTDSEGFAQYLQDEFELLAEYPAGETYYEYSRKDGAFSPLMADGTEKVHVTDALARPIPKRVGGDLIEYGWDPDEGSFTLEVETLPWVEAPTIIAFPADRHFPSGFTMEATIGAIEEWHHDAARQEIELRHDRTQERVRIEIQRKD